MKSSYLTNLVLLVIVISLLWLSQRDDSSSQQDVTVSKLQASDVNHILIERQAKVDIVLQRQQSGWVLVEPFKAKANQTRINLLLSLLSYPIYGQFQPLEQASLAQFGLADPSLTISMNEQRLSFGSIESLSQHRYIMTDNLVYLIQDDVTPLLAASAGSFVDNRLIAKDQHIVRLVVPVIHNNSVDLGQLATMTNADGKWQSNISSLSTDSLKSLVDSWTHAYAMQVSHLSGQQLEGLNQPQVKIWLHAETEPLSFVIRQNEHSLQLINPDLQLQYDFPKALLSQLLPLLDTP